MFSSVWKIQMDKSFLWRIKISKYDLRHTKKAYQKKEKVLTTSI